MTRQECEQKILEKMKEIKAIYDEFGAPSGYLHLCIFSNNISFNNETWDAGCDVEAEKVINVYYKDKKEE